MKDTDARLEKLKAERDHAYAKASEWTARGKEFDRQITEVENMEILRVVRGIAASPEELRGLLNTLRAAGPSHENFINQEDQKLEQNHMETGGAHAAVRDDAAGDHGAPGAGR